VRVYIGVGSNSNSKRNIQRGLQALRQRFGPLMISPAYESEPVDGTGNNYYNLVVGFDSDEPCAAIAAGLHGIETAFISPHDSRPRALDLDLLLYGDSVVDEYGLQLPRTDILEYAFVLKPLADIAGEQVHPLVGRSYRDLWGAFDRHKQRLWPVDLEMNNIANLEQAE